MKCNECSETVEYNIPGVIHCVNCLRKKTDEIFKEDEMAKSGSKSEYDGMTLLLTSRKRIVITSKVKQDQSIIVWTDDKGNLKAEFSK